MESFLESAGWIVIILGLLWFLLIIFCLFDILRSVASPVNKVLWVIIIFLAPFLGCLAYLIFGRNRVADI